MRQRIQTFLYGAFALMMSFSAFATPESKYNLPRGVSSISRDIYDLHMTILWICVAIGIIVFSIMIYSLIFHRKSRGYKAAEFHDHPGLEIVWAIIPFIILVAMAIPATRVLIAMEDTADADITIKATGYQWKWKYDYLDQGISFFSILSTPPDQIQNKSPKDKWYLLEVDNPVVLPIHKRVRILTTANDVLHSWWVPQLGIKRDAIPGFINESWVQIDEPGIYRGQCAELCGVNHGYMPIVVKAVTQEEFKQWTDKQHKAALAMKAASSKTFTLAELMDQGKVVYDKVCAACHQINGAGMPPTFPPIKGSSVVLGPVERHMKLILNGKAGTAMQAFGAQLSDVDIAAVTTYQRNAFGNNTGDVVQPADVIKAR